MPARQIEPPTMEAAISITAMASRCGLSRARFYELIAVGIMPQPCYCLHTRRPLYPRDLIEVCLLVRASSPHLAQVRWSHLNSRTMKKNGMSFLF